MAGNAIVSKLPNECKLISWVGFHGKYPRGVLDGTMFSLSAVVNGGNNKKIIANVYFL